jgi:hypothetical protein
MMNSLVFEITFSTHQALTNSSVATVLINTNAKSVYRLVKALQAVAA